MKLSNLSKDYLKVLNLIISGMPSIQTIQSSGIVGVICFKPCYKWTAFNTKNKKIPK